MNLDVLSGLVGLVFFGLVAWAVRSQSGASVRSVPPDVSPDEIDALRVLGERAAHGTSLSDEELETVDAVMTALYARLSGTNGDEDNSTWRVEDQHRFFRAACYAAATEHPRHSAWPVGASFRTAIAAKLRADADDAPEGWAMARWLPALVADGGTDEAARAFTRLQRARPELAGLVLRWVAMGPGFFAASNPPEHADAFLARLPGHHHPPDDDPLDPVQRWLLSACIYPDYGSDPRLTLAAPGSPAAARMDLGRSWDVHSADELPDMLGRLLEGLHHASFLRRLRTDGAEVDWWPAFREAWPDLDETTGIRAWDRCRAIQVARDGVTAGYLDEEEGWRWVARLGLALRRDFESWDALATNYRGGEAYFCAMTSRRPAHEGLVDWLSSSERSPWRRVAWDIDPEALRALAGG